MRDSARPQRSLADLKDRQSCRRRRLVLVITSLIIVVVGVAFVILGLDQASKAASVTGAFIGLAGLGLSVWTYMQPSSPPKNIVRGNDVRVMNSFGVQVGNRNRQKNDFRNISEPGVVDTRFGSTGAHDEGEHRDASGSGSSGS